MHDEMVGGGRCLAEVESAQRSPHGAEGGARGGWRSASVLAACGAVVLVGLVLGGQPRNAGELLQKVKAKPSTAKHAAMMRLAAKTAGAPALVAAEKSNMALELVRASERLIVVTLSF